MKLEQAFYTNTDVVEVSKQLLGKYLFTRIDGKTTAGIITETEAYAGAADKASHAYGNKRTNRTEPMFSEGGVAYVYLCYGIHHLFNVVIGKKNIPHAVLVRAVQPTEGTTTILQRRNMQSVSKRTAGGPGTVSQALGIKTAHTGILLTGSSIWIEDRGIRIPEEAINIGPRIGVDYAGEDAKRPYRFVVEL